LAALPRHQPLHGRLDARRKNEGQGAGILDRETGMRDPEVRQRGLGKLPDRAP